MKEYSDEELVALFQQGDNTHYAFNLLFRKHREAAYWFIRKMLISHDDADDAVQEVFLKVYHNLSKFRGDSKFTTWLFTICSRQCFDALKKKRKHIFQSVDDVQVQLAATIDSDPMYDADAIRAALDKALLTLPFKQKLVFTLRYFEEKKFAEIAKITGTSEGALKASYHHAVKKVETFLSQL